MPPEVCPHCGAEVPSTAKACPECGSDEGTGWSEEAHADSLGLPDADFNYDEFVKEEFGGKSRLPLGIRWWWWVVAVFVLGAFVVLWLK